MNSSDNSRFRYSRGLLRTARNEWGRPGTVGDGRALVRTAGDYVGRPGMGKDGGARWGTAEEHTNDVS